MHRPDATMTLVALGLLVHLTTTVLSSPLSIIMILLAKEVCDDFLGMRVTGWNERTIHSKVLGNRKVLLSGVDDVSSVTVFVSSCYQLFFVVNIVVFDTSCLRPVGQGQLACHALVALDILEHHRNGYHWYIVRNKDCRVLLAGIFFFQ